MICSKKIVVFDLDETLGYFMELGMLWDALNSYIKNKKIPIKINQNLYNKVLDLYPEFLRPNIINILNYLKKKKQRSHCFKLLIYTNNQGPEEWAKYIINYFEHKLNYKIFDQIVAAFKVNGKHVEICRTTHMKTHKDLIRCTQIPDDSHICFLDDVFYPDMSNDNIYYINIKPYIHDLSFDTMITRLLNSDILEFPNISNNENENENDEKNVCHKFLLSFLKRYHYNYISKDNVALSVDKILSKKIMHHLRLFFKINNGESTNKTKRHKIIKNKTQKVKSKKVQNLKKVETL